MKWIILILTFNLIGCVSKVYEEDPRKCTDPLCLSIAVAMSKSNSQFQKCSDMPETQRKSCESQVESLKKHISDASKK
ncbi:hypothetical protein [Colwellia sp. MB3u-4]|uniref:hypothetical protein n=1 Tax=Colwellia sp. MB3u-4 TaxID=2759822 RepID=UPI0015F6CB43|nr:hypothetical protein [Colwellia sp. MB3u-4]MBA6290005.1 hypothetical protein [Colwellia sp. MB3u-4]